MMFESELKKLKEKAENREKNTHKMKLFKVKPTVYFILFDCSK